MSFKADDDSISCCGVEKMVCCCGAANLGLLEPDMSDEARRVLAALLMKAGGAATA
jgi:hypothetical protein